MNTILALTLTSMVAAHARLCGTVIDADGARAVPGVTVEAIHGKVRDFRLTDSAGHFCFTLPSGVYELTLFKEGYSPTGISREKAVRGKITSVVIRIKAGTGTFG